MGAGERDAVRLPQRGARPPAGQQTGRDADLSGVLLQAGQAAENGNHQPRPSTHPRPMKVGRAGHARPLQNGSGGRGEACLAR